LVIVGRHGVLDGASPLALSDSGRVEDGDDPSNGHGAHGTNALDDSIVDPFYQIKTRQ
jgi:hypothetical protein